MINICCSGSSGLTMLAALLNRHDKIYCGEELGLFSKNLFYEDFEYVRKRAFLISKFGMSSLPYFACKSVLRNLESYGLNKKEVWSILYGSETFHDFVMRLKENILQSTNKDIWAEKTPANIFTIKFF